LIIKICFDLLRRIGGAFKQVNPYSPVCQAWIKFASLRRKARITPEFSIPVNTHFYDSCETSEPFLLLLLPGVNQVCVSVGSTCKYKCLQLSLNEFTLFPSLLPGVDQVRVSLSQGWTDGALPCLALQAASPRIPNRNAACLPGIDIDIDR